MLANQNPSYFSWGHSSTWGVWWWLQATWGVHAFWPILGWFIFRTLNWWWLDLQQNFLGLFLLIPPPTCPRPWSRTGVCGLYRLHLPFAVRRLKNRSLMSLAGCKLPYLSSSPHWEYPSFIADKWSAVGAPSTWYAVITLIKTELHPLWSPENVDGTQFFYINSDSLFTYYYFKK